MSTTLPRLPLEHDTPIPTWFGVGGRADALARPQSPDELAACLEIDADLRVLGDGANLLVADDGVDGLVVKLTGPVLTGCSIDPRSGLVRAGAGADLAKLVHETVRCGLVGLESLVGVPATIGGAVAMNAGGAFGQIVDLVERVEVMTRGGQRLTLERSQIGFGYRRGLCDGSLITAAELRLTPGDPAAARARLREIMRHKAATQPLQENSCGCVFRNPTLDTDLDGIGRAGERVGAGLLLDRAGCKGLTRGACRVSQRHANFIETGPGASASDILRLIDSARAVVAQRFGVTLETEVVIWSRR